MKKSAIISNSGLYRYELHREWDKDKEKVLFIMLNPSTADEKTDDLTTIRCMNFAKKWGYGGIMIGNIYPFRAKRPKDLRKWLRQDRDSNYKTGLGITYARNENKNHVYEMVEQADIVVCAWGCNYSEGIPEWIDELEVPLYYLEMCKDGETPKHPLGNLSKDLKPKMIDLDPTVDMTDYKLNTIIDG